MALSVASYTNIASGWFVTTTPRSITGLSWSAGDTIVVIGGSPFDNTTLSNPTNANLTFGAPQATIGAGSGDSQVWLWAATAGSDQTGQAIAGSCTGGGVWGMAAWVITGGSATLANATANLTEAAISRTVSAGSVVIYGLIDWNATNPPGKTPATGSGTATERLDQGNGTDYGQYLCDWVGTSAGTFSFGPNNYTDLRVSQAVIEVVVVPAETEQEGFRWRNDDGDEDAATWRQTQDTADEAELDEVVRLRVLLNTTEDVASTQFQLEYKQDSETWYRPIGIGYPGTLPTITSATGTADATAGTTVAASYPATVNAGDLLIFVVAKDDDATGITDTTGGLNVIGNGNTGSGTDGVCLFAGWMIAAGSEDGGTRTFTGDSEEWQTYCVRILAGEFDASNPIDSASALNGATTGEAITAAFNCIRPGGLVIACGAVDIDPMDATFSPSGWTDVADNDAGEVTAWVSTRDAATTVGETIASATFGINASDANVALAFVVNAPLGTAAVTHALSANYADGTATTFQLAAPAGKSTSDFDAGVMVEGQALADAVDIDADDYTEIEWALKAQTPAVVGNIFQFRATANGTPLTTYTVTPELEVVAAGGTVFEEDLAGTITGTGALAKLVGKQVAGSSTGTGALRKLAAKVVAGSSTGTGAIAKAISRILAGSSTPSGSLATLRTIAQALTGSVTGSGTATKAVGKAASGSTTPSGAPANLTAKGLDGEIEPSGELTALRTIVQALTGSITATGAVAKAVSKTIAGTIESAGALAKAISKNLAGEITPSGEVTFLNTVELLLQGTITGVGAVVKAIGKAASGSTTPSGAPANLTSKGLDGEIEPSGTLTATRLFSLLLEGAVTAAGALLKLVSKSTTGSTTPEGDPNQAVSKGLNGSVTPSGTLEQRRVISMLLEGAVTAAGSLAKSSAKLLTGTVTTVGFLAKLTVKLLTGTITGTGGLTTSGGTPTVPGDMCVTVDVGRVVAVVECGGLSASLDVGLIVADAS